MSSGNKPEEIQDLLVLGGFDDIRLVMSEKHNRILRLVLNDEQTISDIARKLGMNPGSVHYYLKDLEKHGLVRQVRDEISGGVVKKYYRASARRIALELPEFDSRDGQGQFPGPDHLLRLIRSIEHLGYRLSPEDVEDASELLERYRKRMTTLRADLQKAGLEEIEDDGFVIDAAYDLVLYLRAKEDPEINRVYAGLGRLFQQCK